MNTFLITYIALQAFSIMSTMLSLLKGEYPRIVKKHMGSDIVLLFVSALFTAWAAFILAK